MKIVYYTSGTTGIGRLVQGISIGNALKRRNADCQYTIVSSSDVAHLSDIFGINHIEVPPENEDRLSQFNWSSSILYQILMGLDPDVLLIDLMWFTLYYFIEDLKCKKIFLCRQVDESFFTISLPDYPISFQPDDFNLILKTEPFKTDIPMTQINPIIIRNRNEIFTRDEAMSRLGLDPAGKYCLMTYSGDPNDFENKKMKYDYLKDDDFTMIYWANYHNTLFPAVDYYNAFDFIISSAGYNSFWEAVYFQKDSLFIPQEKRFEDHQMRIDECSDFRYEENGADQLVDLIIK